MSGSPGRTTRFDPGDAQGTPVPSGGPKNACAILTFETPLNSPVPSVVAKLKKGSDLKLRKAVSGAAIRIEAVTMSYGEVAGTITSQFLPQLISCLDSGFEYLAVVTTDPSGGYLNLLVRCKAQ